MTDILYKNPNRNSLSDSNVRSKNTPYHKTIGVEPVRHEDNKFKTPPQICKGGVTEEDNPRLRKQTLSQEPLQTTDIPNVGNNVEWFGLDEQSFGEEKLDPNAKMIDNNLIVEEELTQNESLENDDLSSIEDNSYILILNGTILSKGSSESIEKLATELVFGENPICNGQPIPIEDIVVLKKVKIKIGLFLE